MGICRYEYHLLMEDKFTQLAMKAPKRLRAGLLSAIKYHREKRLSLTIEEGMEEI